MLWYHCRDFRPSTGSFQAAAAHLLAAGVLLREPDWELQAFTLANYCDVEDVAQPRLGKRPLEIGDGAHTLAVNPDYQIKGLADVIVIDQAYRGEGRRKDHGDTHHCSPEQGMDQP